VAFMVLSAMLVAWIRAARLIRALCRRIEWSKFMSLYTFVMDYAGGTYISQVKAPSPKSACVKWVQKLDHSQVKGLGLKGKESLIEQKTEESPVTLDGMLNAWCASAHVRGRLALINLVQTERERNNL
jgi:hypothetical protein